MNKRRKRYGALRTIDEVRAERMRLHRMKRTNANHLAEDWDDVKYALSPAALLERAMDRVAGVSPLMGNIYAGIRTAMALFGGRKNCGC